MSRLLVFLVACVIAHLHFAYCAQPKTQPTLDADVEQPTVPLPNTDNQHSTRSKAFTHGLRHEKAQANVHRLYASQSQTPVAQKAFSREDLASEGVSAWAWVMWVPHAVNASSCSRVYDVRYSDSKNTEDVCVSVEICVHDSQTSVRPYFTIKTAGAQTTSAWNVTVPLDVNFDSAWTFVYTAHSFAARCTFAAVYFVDTGTLYDQYFADSEWPQNETLVWSVGGVASGENDTDQPLPLNGYFFDAQFTAGDQYLLQLDDACTAHNERLQQHVMHLTESRKYLPYLGGDVEIALPVVAEHEEDAQDASYAYEYDSTRDSNGELSTVQSVAVYAFVKLTDGQLPESARYQCFSTLQAGTTSKVVLDTVGAAAGRVLVQYDANGDGETYTRAVCGDQKSNDSITTTTTTTTTQDALNRWLFVYHAFNAQTRSFAVYVRFDDKSECFLETDRFGSGDISDDGRGVIEKFSARFSDAENIALRGAHVLYGIRAYAHDQSGAARFVARASGQTTFKDGVRKA